MSEQEPKAIEFGTRRELDPEKEAEYRDQIAKARSGSPLSKLKGSQPVGGAPPLKNLPNFQNVLAQAQEASGLTPEGGVSPRPPGSPVIRQETADQLQAMAAASAQAKQQKVEETKLNEEAVQADAKKDDIWDLFNMDLVRNEAERILNNKERRKGIESRCQPMNFEDLLLRDEVQQRVPIKPGQFEPLFRSITAQENLFLKRYISKDQGSEQYLMDKFGLCQLACGIVDINGRPFADHRDKNGDPEEKAFEEKLKQVLKKSGYIIADLAVNYTWFDLRVRKLINPDALGNG